MAVLVGSSVSAGRGVKLGWGVALGGGVRLGGEVGAAVRVWLIWLGSRPASSGSVAERVQASKPVPIKRMVAANKDRFIAHLYAGRCWVEAIE